jgi:hypothetical protein
VGLVDPASSASDYAGTMTYVVTLQFDVGCSTINHHSAPYHSAFSNFSDILLFFATNKRKNLNETS